jgi:hypothetical protein
MSISEQTTQWLKPMTLGRVSSTKPHRFLSINGEEREKVMVSHHERQRRRRTLKNAKNERKSSVLKSLAVLDIEDGDADYQSLNDISHHTQQTSTDSSSNHSQRRYMRRGSVTRHKLEADLIGMQPSEKKCDGGDKSDYGKNYDSEYDQEKERKRYLRRGSVTKYSLDYASVGAEMQPANVASSHEKMFKRGGVVVDKERLPPLPTNDSFRVDDDKDILQSPSVTSQSYHIPKQSTSGPRTIRSKSGRPSRRGSMKMPAHVDPRPGDDYWSGNINDSGHHRRDVYFDSPEEILSPRSPETQTTGYEPADVSSSVHSVASAPPSSAKFHPITPHKPRSGRRICVDEAELFTHEEKSNDHRQTILPSIAKHNLGQNPMFDRRDSGSSLESDESSVASFGAESVEEADTKIPVAPHSRAPRLPPAYSSTLKAPTCSNNSNLKKPPPHFANNGMRASLAKRLSGGTTSSSEDSTGSSQSIEDFPITSLDATEVIPRNVVATTIGQSYTNKMKFSRTKNSTNEKYAAVGNKRGCLRDNSKTSSNGRQKKVQFDRIVITEFPIILGDNPAVTSGAPVTIDWNPQGEREFSVDSYEQCKPARRRRRRLLISVSHRAILLLAAGYSIDDIADASINAQQIKFSRQESMNASQYRERVSLLMENTNDAFSGMVHNTGKKLKALITKPVQHSETARTA